MPDAPSDLKGGANEALRSFNLLPWRERRQKMRRRGALVALAGGATGALVLLAAIEFPFRYRIHAEEERSARLRIAISLERRGAAEREALETRRAQASSLLAEVERIHRRNSTAREWLAALPAQMPAGVRLARLELDGQMWELRGRADGISQPAALLKRVREMPMVSEARIEQLQNNPDMTRAFVLRGKLGE